jgi:hypothetical protein
MHLPVVDKDIELQKLFEHINLEDSFDIEFCENCESGKEFCLLDIQLQV